MNEKISCQTPFMVFIVEYKCNCAIVEAILISYVACSVVVALQVSKILQFLRYIGR